MQIFQYGFTIIYFSFAILNSETVDRSFMKLLHGRYEIIRELGTGGMSQVYLCVDNHIKKLWAIKKIPYGKSNLNLIEGEIKMLKELDYYLFPRITDAFVDNEAYYIVTDYIEGESLNNILPLSEEVAIKYTRELLNALLFLHNQSPPILYLDMKPSNIMVREDGSIRLIDFGIAQSVIEPSKNLGTKGYAAPEQYTCNGTLSEKTDVFSLGMTLYAMLTGDKPFASYSHQINAIKNSDRISRKMKNLILECTKFEAVERMEITAIKGMLNGLEKEMRRLKLFTFTAILVASVLCISISVISKREIVRDEKETSRKMVMEISKFVDDGEYTKDGIRIICGYLDGNFLDEESSEYYTYVVARNLFEIQRDYSNAKRYFDRLNKDKYPESIYFSKICESMTGFSRDDNEFKACVNEFERYNSTVSDKNKREKNKELISFIKLNYQYEKMGGTNERDI